MFYRLQEGSNFSAEKKCFHDDFRGAVTLGQFSPPRKDANKRNSDNNNIHY